MNAALEFTWNKERRINIAVQKKVGFELLLSSTHKKSLWQQKTRPHWNKFLLLSLFHCFSPVNQTLRPILASPFFSLISKLKSDTWEKQIVPKEGKFQKLFLKKIGLNLAFEYQKCPLIYVEPFPWMWTNQAFPVMPDNYVVSAWMMGETGNGVRFWSNFF